MMNKNRCSVNSGFYLCLFFLPIVQTEVEYVCFSDNTRTLRLRCPVGQRILIEESLYGRSRWGSCLYIEKVQDAGGSGGYAGTSQTGEHTGTGQKAGGAGSRQAECTQTSHVGLDCCGRSACSVPATPVHLPVCGYTSDFLRVVYQCVRDTNVTCGPKRAGLFPADTTTLVPPEVVDFLSRTTSQAWRMRAESSADNTVNRRIILKDFRRMQERMRREDGGGRKIFGYNAESVIAFFTTGAAIILFLCGLVLYISRRPIDSYKFNSVSTDTSPHSTSSKRDEFTETIFFDAESSVDTRSTRSELMACFNDAFLYDVESETVLSHNSIIQSENANKQQHTQQPESVLSRKSSKQPGSVISYNSDKQPESIPSYSSNNQAGSVLTYNSTKQPEQWTDVVYSECAKFKAPRLSTFFKEAADSVVRKFKPLPPPPLPRLPKSEEIECSTERKFKSLPPPPVPRVMMSDEDSSPALSFTSSSSTMSLPDADDEHEDSGVETAPNSCDPPSENSPSQQVPLQTEEQYETPNCRQCNHSTSGEVTHADVINHLDDVINFGDVMQFNELMPPDAENRDQSNCTETEICQNLDTEICQNISKSECKDIDKSSNKEEFVAQSEYSDTDLYPKTEEYTSIISGNICRVIIDADQDIIEC